MGQISACSQVGHTPLVAAHEPRRSVTPELRRESMCVEQYPASLQGPSVLALGETPGPLTHKAFTRPA